MEFGFAAEVNIPMDGFAKRARLIESLGFDYFWVPDERLLRNVYVSLSTAAVHTRKIQLGIGVTNPYSRNPAITAAAIATIDELSGGRTTLGLGAGGGLEAYGIRRESPREHIREAIEIVRSLTRGESVDHAGRWFSVIDTQLDFAPLREVPVFVAGRGPKTLELAGEAADGVIIGGFAKSEGLHFAKNRISEGLSKSGRTWADITTVAWIFISVSDVQEAARVAVSRMVLAAMLSSRPILTEIGVHLPDELRVELDRTRWSYGQVPRAAAMLTNEIIDAFAVYGTPEECARRLSEVCDVGVDQIAFVALPAKGSSVEQTARTLAEKVIPLFRAQRDVDDL